MVWFGSRIALVLTVQVLLENPFEIAVHFLFKQRIIVYLYLYKA